MSCCTMKLRRRSVGRAEGSGTDIPITVQFMSVSSLENLVRGRCWFSDNFVSRPRYTAAAKM